MERVTDDFPQRLERRQECRTRRRAACDLWVNGRLHRGMVMDGSEAGVFVQTDADPSPGSTVRLRIHGSRGVALDADATVVRRLVVPQYLSNVVPGGLGLCLHPSPPTDELPPKTPGSRLAAPSLARPERPLRFFRVVLARHDRPGLRTLVVGSEGREEDAISRALAHTGRGWSVLEARLD